LDDKIGSRKRLSDITPQEVSARITRLRDTLAEANHAHVTAKVFFNWPRRSHYIDRSPLEGTLPPARTIARDRVLEDKELAAVFRTAIEDDNIFSNIVSLLILTGCRRGEVAALRWGYIDDKARLITLPSTVTKNGRTHSFPYGELSAQVFEAVPRLSDYLFPASRSTARGKPTTVFNGWGKAKVDFDKRCGVDFRLHDLRRTFATNMAALGTPVQVTEKLLNHVSGSLGGIVAIYNRHNYLDEMREAVHAWETKLRKLVA
jgi:integrase